MVQNNFKSIAFIITSALLSLPCYSQNVFVEANKTKTSNSAAMRILQNTLSNNPKSITAKLACARVYIKNGNYKEAEDLIMMVLEEDPNNTKANKLLKELNQQYSTHIDEFKDDYNSEIKTVSAIPSQVEKPIEKPVEQPIEQKTISPKLSEPIEIQKVEEKNSKDLSVKQEESNTIKLPTKEEILKKARARKQAKEQSIENDNLPIAIQAPNKGKTKEVKITQEVENQDKTEFIEPITISPQIKEEQKSVNQSSLLEKKTPKKEEESLDNYKFTPFISNQRTQNKINELKSSLKYAKEGLQKEAPILDSSTGNNRTEEIFEDISKAKFLERVSSSFLINLDEAYCKIESNKLEEACLFLDIATTLAVAEKDNKKLLDARLTRAVIYIYQCDFEKYGNHILTLRKGVSEDIYNSLQKIYETGAKLNSESSLLKYASNLAYDSCHYLTALDLAKKIQPSDSESRDLIEKTNKAVNQINGEYLLNKGSYMYALEFFEKENDEAEQGRTYLAISKSLQDADERRESEIAEQFGRSCLFNCIKNDPNNPKANLYLALYFLDKGDKNQAKEAIRRGLNAQGENDIITSKLLNLSENL